MPAVSVLMVFHRVTPFLVPAVRSVLTQTFRDLELVLVDDGTGLGVEPLGEWGRDPRIQLVTRPTNGGIAKGHVAALAHARGDYFALLDSDDIALPDRIERQVAVLRAEPRLGLVSTRVEAIDERGQVTGPEFCLLGEQEQKIYTAYTAAGVTSSYAGRREVFLRFPYRLEFDCATDYDFFSRAAEVCPIRGIPEILTQYRRHPEQVTQQRASEQIAAACLIRLLTARRRHGRPEDLAGLVAEHGGWLRDPPTPAEAYARFARLALREGFAPLAVYHARKLLSVRRDIASCVRAARALAGALRIAPGDAALLLRLFFTGPLRAHRLKPA
jgi:glycosyltransferase involved in cell wall biosynthesis